MLCNLYESHILRSIGVLISKTQLRPYDVISAASFSMVISVGSLPKHGCCFSSSFTANISQTSLSGYTRRHVRQVVCMRSPASQAAVRLKAVSAACRSIRSLQSPRGLHPQPYRCVARHQQPLKTRAASSAGAAAGPAAPSDNQEQQSAHQHGIFGAPAKAWQRFWSLSAPSNSEAQKAKNLSAIASKLWKIMDVNMWLLTGALICMVGALQRLM